jgi:hypothetical protein
VKTIISSSFHACLLMVSIWTSRIKKAKEKASLFCRRCWSALHMLGSASMQNDFVMKILDLQNTRLMW